MAVAANAAAYEIAHGGGATAAQSTTSNSPSTSGYGGDAFGLSVSTLFPRTSEPVIYFDSGQLAASGGETDALPTTVKTSAVSAEGLLSTSTGSNGKAEGQSGLASLDLLHGTPAEVTATFVMSSATATCSGVSGNSEITNLKAGGQSVDVTGAPDQVVTVPGVLKLTINEQTSTSTSIRVNALHLQTPLGEDIIASEAYSSISCPSSQPSSSHDFVSGGGWLSNGGTSGVFGFVAGYRQDLTSLGGSLVFVDPGTGMKVVATTVTSYSGNGNSRSFAGAAMVNGGPGYSYKVKVFDGGTTGAGHASFTIQLSNGYNASGTLGGGTIEVHR